MDTLSDLLNSMRLAGGVFLDGEMRGPWSILSQVTRDECGKFFPAMPPSTHIIAYHYVRSGWLECQVEGDEETLKVKAGEIVLLPRNRPHFLYGPIRSEPIDSSQMVLPVDADGLYKVRLGEAGEITSVYCGFLASTTPDNMLLTTLPPIMVIGIADVEAGEWIRRSLDFAAHGLSSQSPEMVGKLAEGLFAEAVRRYIDALPEDSAGWLAGLKDPAVGRTIALIHRDFAEALTLEDLAHEARVSKTVLGERFRQLLGEAPMQYCARWRMHVAADMLRNDRQNACSVAYSVGFNSEAAFNRAFKREYGLPPAAWQRTHATAVQ